MCPLAIHQAISECTGVLQRWNEGVEAIAKKLGQPKKVNATKPTAMLKARLGIVSDLRANHDKLRQVIQKAFMGNLKSGAGMGSGVSMPSSTGGPGGAAAGSSLTSSLFSVKATLVAGDGDIMGVDALAAVDAALLVFQGVDVLDVAEEAAGFAEASKVRLPLVPPSCACPCVFAPFRTVFIKQGRVMYLFQVEPCDF
jgi:hypothetical protein